MLLIQFSKISPPQKKGFFLYEIQYRFKHQKSSFYNLTQVSQSETPDRTRVSGIIDFVVQFLLVNRFTGVMDYFL